MGKILPDAGGPFPASGGVDVRGAGVAVSGTDSDRTYTSETH